MKTAGLVIALVGGLMVLSAIRLAVTEYDLSSSHDLSKLLGGMGVSLLIVVAGLFLYAKGRTTRAE